MARRKGVGAERFVGRKARREGEPLDRIPRYILGVVAVGLVAYGAFMFVMARYRRIEPA